MIELAVRNNVLIAGDDFKSGQTKLKSVLVDFLVGDPSQTSLLLAVVQGLMTPPAVPLSGGLDGTVQCSWK